MTEKEPGRMTSLNRTRYHSHGLIEEYLGICRK